MLFSLLISWLKRTAAAIVGELRMDTPWTPEMLARCDQRWVSDIQPREFIFAAQSIALASRGRGAGRIQKGGLPVWKSSLITQTAKVSSATEPFRNRAYCKAKDTSERQAESKNGADRVKMGPTVALRGAPEQPSEMEKALRDSTAGTTPGAESRPGVPLRLEGHTCAARGTR
jgi:hypothetical protein